MEFKAKIKDIQYFLSSIDTMTSEDFKKSLKLSENDFLSIETWKERNINFHRKYFALIKCALYHLPESFDEEFHNIEKFRYYLMIIIGEFTLIPSLKGEPIPKANSISFKSIDEVKFQEIYNKTLNAIMKHFLKYIPLEDFEKDIMNFYNN